MVSVLIKTFERPEALKRLIASIPKGIPVMVVDDSREPQYLDNVEVHTLPFDSGLSLGRNFGVSYVKTPYVFLCDDDCIFTDQTDLRRAVELIGDNDLLGIDCGINYKGHYEVEGETVRLVPGEPYEFIPNIFLAKTESLRKHRWDDRLKMGEHFAYFFTHRGKLKIGYTDQVSIRHEHISNDTYDPFRKRAMDCVRQFMKENNIKKRIDLYGETLS